MVANTDHSIQQTDKILLIADVFLRGLRIGESLKDDESPDSQNEALTPKLIGALDLIQVELAERVNELTVEQIGNLCFSLASLVEVV
mgnify:CR=1 FL=1